MHTTTSYTAGDDHGYNSLIIPIEANVNIAVIQFDNGTGPMIQSVSQGSRGFSCMFIAIDGTSKALQNASISLAKGLLYDTYYGCLYGLYRNLAK